MPHDQETAPEPSSDAYVRLAKLLTEFEELAPLLQPAVAEQDSVEMNWLIGSTKQVLGKAMTVIERQF